MKATDNPAMAELTLSSTREELTACIIACAELLPMNQLLTAARSIKEATGAFLETVDSCPHCGGKSFVKNGHRHGKQAYICRSCGKTFVSTTGTVRYWSHQSRAVWEDAISDTLNGIPLRKTSERLGISKDVAFDIRHKVMLALEKDVADMKQPEEEPDPWVSVSDSKDCSSATGAAGAKPDAIKEMDETFVLESYKGSKLGDGFWRKPRKHGAKAQKPGISEEQVCICASVDRDGNAYAKTVNRASPTVEELKEVFAGRLTPGTLAVCDGLKAYKPLCKDAGCTMVDVKKVSEEESALINLNSVNGFHSLIKRVLREYCGVATKYQNRYNALFVAMYKLTPQRECDIIRRLLTISTDSCNSTNVDVKEKNLLDLGYIT